MGQGYLPKAAVTARLYPDPFNGSVNALLGETAWRQLLEDRSRNLRTFNAESDKLAASMRAFLNGQHAAENAIESESSDNLFTEDGMLWRDTDGKRCGPYCLTCLETGRKEISLLEGATRGVYTCPIHQTQFWTKEFRDRASGGFRH